MERFGGGVVIIRTQGVINPPHSAVDLVTVYDSRHRAPFLVGNHSPGVAEPRSRGGKAATTL
jgi:hypothetical protein